MIDRLQIPKLLSGRWANMVIMTYGADLAFFENALWRELPARCKNIIIMADGEHYVRVQTDSARTGLVRHINRKYVFDGIFSSHAVHAKLILLTSPDEGRLLVGSGNLGWQGYASGGEMFTLYEYTPDTDEMLPAFLSVRGLLEHLMDANALHPVTNKHLANLFETTPWLFRSSNVEGQPIRHNVRASFLEQLKEAVGTERVEQLWVLTPFFDPAVRALDRFLSVFSPNEFHLLVQPGDTSVDPDALNSVLSGKTSNVSVHIVSLPGELAGTFIHAKLYLLKTPTRAICLQGSPNMSQVAMLRTWGNGNLELANLQIGTPDAFDYLLAYLDISSPVINLRGLDLRYHQGDEDGIQDTEECPLRLFGADFDGKQVVCYLSGEPDGDLGIIIGEKSFPLTGEITSSDNQVSFALPEDAIALVEAGFPIALQCKGNVTNAIYPWNQPELNALLEVRDTDVPWNVVGELGVEDEILEQLLIDLDANLILDRRSVWQLASRPVSSSVYEQEESLRLDYADIDYEQLRRHPKLQQYVSGKRGSSKVFGKSALQTLFHSILDHFNHVVERQMGQVPPSVVLDGEQQSTDTDTEEAEANAEETQRRRKSTAQRIRRLFKHFVQRFIRGLSSPDFWEFAGPDVMTKNYVIFSHILWRMFYRDELENEFIIDAFLQTWPLFWGKPDCPGVFATFDKETQREALRFIREYKTDAELLAVLYYSATILESSGESVRKLKLRDFVRDWLLMGWVPPTKSVLEDAWVIIKNLFPYAPPQPSSIVSKIAVLAYYETMQSFLLDLEHTFGFSENSCRLERVSVYRAGLGKSTNVEQLRIGDPGVQLTQELAVSIAACWKRFRPLDYFRIISHDGTQIFWYEDGMKEGLLHNKQTHNTVEIKEELPTQPYPWELPLMRWEQVARDVEQSKNGIKGEFLHFGLGRISKASSDNREPLDG